MIQQQTEELQISYLQLSRSTIHQSRPQLLASNIEDIKSHVDSQLNQIITLTSVKCSSFWLTALSLQEQGFYLNKQEFLFFSTDHAMICQHGGLTFTAIMNYMISWQDGYRKCVMMSLLNLLYYHSLGSLLLHLQLIIGTMPELIYMQGASREKDKVHFLTYRCFISMHQVISRPRLFPILQTRA